MLRTYHRFGFTKSCCAQANVCHRATMLLVLLMALQDIFQFYTDPQQTYITATDCLQCIYQYCAESGRA